MTGKKKCKILREIRRRIADENDIPFVTEECEYKGDCRGVCPKCESEVRYLEAQLEKRRSLGRRVTLSALALGVAAAGLAGCRAEIAGDPSPLEGDVPFEETTEVLQGEITKPEAYARMDDAAFAPDSPEGSEGTSASAANADADAEG